ncbi:MAG: ECF transporter S component [Tissierellia bacterium]|nr:ECF transporter S component [Tissierellia bacterium]
MEMTSRNKTLTVNTMVKISIFSAMAGILMTVLKFPLPFAPTFMTVDFGDVPTLISGFALGPIAGIITVILKNLINLMINGTTTAYVGELSNIIVGSTFVGISSIIYHRNKTRKNAAIGLVIGILAMSMLATLSNYFVIFPLYAKMFGMPLEGFVKAVPASNTFVKSYFDVMVFAVVPFNIVKGLFNALATLAIYKYISSIFKKF